MAETPERFDLNEKGDPEKIAEMLNVADHKYLDPECSEKGCKGLFLDQALAELAALKAEKEAVVRELREAGFYVDDGWPVNSVVERDCAEEQFNKTMPTLASWLKEGDKE